IYFTTQDPESGTRPGTGRQWDDDGAAFFVLPADPQGGTVRPGKHMVIGSGDDDGNQVFESLLGSKTDGSPADVKIKMRPGGSRPIQLVNEGQGQVIASSTSATTDALVVNGPRRLTVSEPPKGYPRRVRNVEWDGNASVGPGREPGAYVLGGQNGGTPKPIDTPLDADGPDALALLQIGNHAAFRWIYLQRLANPMLPWNPEPLLPDGNPNPKHDDTLVVNPYLTVDQSAVNITVFNGEDARNETKRLNRSKARNEFASLERGRHNDPTNPRAATDKQSSLLSVESPDLRKDGRPGGGDHIFDAIPALTLGSLNKSFDADGDQRPDEPFPWLTWNNRPYISSNELMHVPAVRSSQLLRSFTTPETAPKAPQDAYADDPINISQNETPRSPLIVDGPFGHLLNFFRYEVAAGGSGNAGLYRLLEYIQVPSRYVGTETWLNPKVFRGQNSATADMTLTTDPRFHRGPPFNRISSHRDPGRVNVNTIVADEVWEGLFHGEPRPEGGDQGVHVGPMWDTLKKTRRKPSGTSTDMLDLDDSLPTFFGNPFRSPDAGDLVPLVSMIHTGVDCTFLRSMDSKAATSGNPPSSGGNPVFAAATTTDYNNAARNSYFRYQPMTRLDNLVTTRSNVYAVWITIAFFEVEPAPSWINDEAHPVTGTSMQTMFPTQALYNRVYPDGYMLAKESGAETGETRRLRGFYVIDRSIPVGFEPGADHNVEDAIRLRRRIE
ncbi:hypothetical protein OAS39_13460, partial [Pirellulales bacterium]|nr:hypothetical protein [Pirellulales bacterium]